MSCKSTQYKGPKGIGNDMLSVVVGPSANSTKFSIHKNLLQKLTSHFDGHEALDAAGGQQGVLAIEDEDPEIFDLLFKWAYTGNVEKCQTKLSVKKRVSNKAEVKELEQALLNTFDEHMVKLLHLYILAEKYEIHDLMNKTIDNIQDGYNEFGTTFGPRLHQMIFLSTKPDSKLRDLDIGSLFVHFDRGCSQLRDEVATASLMLPGFMSHMLRWIAQNFAMFGRRERLAKDGFSMFNRDMLCPCLFHVHIAGPAHSGHRNCSGPRKLTCEHPKDENQDTEFWPAHVFGARGDH